MQTVAVMPLMAQSTGRWSALVPVGAIALGSVGCTASTNDAAGPTKEANPPSETRPEDGGAPAPSERMQSQADSIGLLVGSLAQRSAWHEPVDADAVIQRERAAILTGDGSDAVFYGAAWRALNAFPQGHQSLAGAAGTKTCGRDLPYQNDSRFSVCGRPSKEGIAVTMARAGNLLGLRAGDVVVRANDDAGEAMLEASYLRPVCGNVFPSRSGRRTAGAASFFGNVTAGTVLTVRAPNGQTRQVVVPSAGDGRLTNCGDPFGREQWSQPEATIRPDGVAVIRLPTLTPIDDNSNPTTEAETLAYIERFQSKVAAVFDTVKSAPTLIWDIRGNIGGISPVAMAIVGGFASARPTSVSYCLWRTVGSPTPSFEGPKYAEYAVTPGGPFRYTGKVAVVTDGLTYSAGEYMTLATSVASDVPLVGSATAGAYGGSRLPLDVEGPPPLVVEADMSACMSASGKPLDGTTAPLAVDLDYEPADLAAGTDTLLEAAVRAAR